MEKIKVQIISLCGQAKIGGDTIGKETDTNIA